MHTFFVFKDHPMTRAAMEGQYSALTQDNETIAGYQESADGYLMFGTSRFLSQHFEVLRATTEPLYQAMLDAGEATPDAVREWVADGEGFSFKVNDVVWLHYSTEPPPWFTEDI